MIPLRRRIFGYGKSKEEQEAKARDDERKLVEEARNANYRATLEAKRHEARIAATDRLAKLEAEREIQRQIHPERGGREPGAFHKVTGQPFFFKPPSQRKEPHKKKKGQTITINLKGGGARKPKKKVHSVERDYSSWMP